MRVVKRPASQASDYSALERPAVQRYARAVGDGVGAAPVDEELLDIPAFLRRQADWQSCLKRQQALVVR